MNLVTRLRARGARSATILAFIFALTSLGLVRSDVKQNFSQPPILDYISASWGSLTRSLDRCDTVIDPKLASDSVVYLPAGYSAPSILDRLRHECNVSIDHLSNKIRHLGEINPSRLNPPGLLYLEHPYVVPGGRFNEMYGWDSYFIIRGLLRDGQLALAQGMLENFFFEVENYGAVLNANRTYYLSRSQPPFLTSMILAIYDAGTASNAANRDWLAKAYGYAKQDYAIWTREPHLAGDTGLSRYFDFGEGPAPETLKDEPDYYTKVAAFFEAHSNLSDGVLAAPNPNQPPGGAALSADFYEGDRAMRESGFDISFRFAPYGARTHHYAPVCLNSLLYKEEKDLERISGILGRRDEAADWRRRAAARRARINQYLWDPKRGEFFDYDFEKAVHSTYEYATTFYPLWVGLAAPEQARAVARNIKKFEQPGGLATSTHATGVQWDYPYVWAPIQLLAIEGLRRYGFREAANRLSFEFLSMVKENYERDATIREKYNAVTRSSEIQVSAGYQTNVVGFGWTNGVFLELLHDLPKETADQLAPKR